MISILFPPIVVFLVFNETEVHVEEDAGPARVCLHVTNVQAELLRSVVVYAFTQDDSAESKLIDS